MESCMNPKAQKKASTCRDLIFPYLLDDTLEYVLSKQGRETVALAALTVACLVGIGITIRYG